VGLISSLPGQGTKLIKRLASRSSSNFKFAFLFLGSEQRQALEQVYGFCRVVDDIVDERPPGELGVRQAENGLTEWRDEITRMYADEDFRDGVEREAQPRTKLGKRLAGSRRVFDMPRMPFDEIIEGCAMDLDRDRYADMEELELYCFRVASCVGLLCIAIFGDQGPAAQEYARHLGLALQYTNILRDVAEDAARGRIYLPQDLLAKHGLTDEDVMKARYDHRFMAVARDFADIAEREYQAAWRAFGRVDNPRGLLPAEIMGRTYYEILRDIRARAFNVFTQRASLRRRDKLRVAASAIARTVPPRVRARGVDAASATGSTSGDGPTER
jgi:phytoene synthase